MAEGSSYPSVRKATGPRVPILDPWADEPTMPTLRIDPVLHTLQVEGDEVMVQMRRGAARVVEEEDGVITSAAPLDHTLGRNRVATPPARRVTATGEQPPGHIADATTGVPPKGGAAKPHLSNPPKLPEKPVPLGETPKPPAQPATDASPPKPPPPTRFRRPRRRCRPPSPAKPPHTRPRGARGAASRGGARGTRSTGGAPARRLPSEPRSRAGSSRCAEPAVTAPPQGPPSTATVPSFRLDGGGRRATGTHPVTTAARVPLPQPASGAPPASIRSGSGTAAAAAQPTVSQPPAAQAQPPAAQPILPREPPRAPTLRSLPAATMPRPRPVTIPPPAAAAAASRAPIPRADAGPAAKSAATVRVPLPPSRPPPPAAGTTIPKPVPAAPPAPSVRAPLQRTPPPPQSAPPPLRRPPRSSRAAAPAEPARGPTARVLDASALESVEALADVPPETRALLASRARVEVLGADDEVSAFGAALVIEGSSSVSATIVDAPVAHAVAGTLVPTRGTFADAVALRVVAGPDGARVALWDQSVLDEALGSCPWVLEELVGRADRLQALAGATMGPLGELDEASRDGVLDKLVVCVLRAGEAVDAEGIAAALVGAGSVELSAAGKSVVVRAGEVLFPRVEAQDDAKAGAHGTILLVGDAGFAADLDAGPPSLRSLFAAR